MPIYQLADKKPSIDPASYVSDEATVIGDVGIAADASVWPGAVVRGDEARIEIGAQTNIQDGSVLHADPGVPLTIGERVTVGHQAMLHGCTIGDGTLIGMQAIVLNRSVIGKHSLVGAGAVVLEDKEFPEGSFILGAPAKVARPLSDQELQLLQMAADSYVQRGREYREHLVRLS